MGLKPREVKEITLNEFDMMYRGYHKRFQLQWDINRHLMACIINYAGMGAKDRIKPQDLWPLDLDKENEQRMITTLSQAMEMLKEFKRWQG